MRKIKVLHHTGGMNRAGTETLLMNIYRNIDRKLIEFHFISHYDTPCDYDEEIIKLGGKIIYIPTPKKIGIKSYLGYLNKVMQKEKYDIFHTHLLFFSGMATKIARKNNISKIITHAHLTSDGVENNLKRIIYRKYMRYLINKYSTYKLGCSNEAIEYLFGKKTDAILFENSIDFSKYSHLKDKNYYKNLLGFSEDKIVIGHVGRFERQKNHKFIIDLFHECLKKNERFRLVLVGDGSLKNEIIEYVKNRQIEEYVSFLGVREDIPDIISAFDTFVFPSLFEGLGIVLLEAQLAGIQCIASTEVPQLANLDIGLLKYLSLEDKNEWAIMINKNLEENRKVISFEKRKEAFKIKGYDLEENCKLLMKIYGVE